ncbi:MAG: SDR family NAD(P)-dependent oxidoreductase [Armatimonadota bacterium]
MEELTGKTAVVTGGTRGLGRAIAERLITMGVNVVVCCRHDPHVLDTIEALKTLGGGQIGGMQCDVARFEEVHTLFEYVADKFGGTDILINNAAVPQRGRLTEMAPFPDECDMTINTNLNGAAYCCHEAVAQMADKGGGWIVNISTLPDQLPEAHAAYSASKEGLLAFSKSLSAELQEQRIHVGVIQAGLINTTFWGDYPDNGERLLQPEDVAEAVVAMVTAPTRALPYMLEIRSIWE